MQRSRQRGQLVDETLATAAREDRSCADDRVRGVSRAAHRARRQGRRDAAPRLGRRRTRASHRRGARSVAAAASTCTSHERAGCLRAWRLVEGDRVRADLSLDALIDEHRDELRARRRSRSVPRGGLAHVLVLDEMTALSRRSSATASPWARCDVLETRALGRAAYERLLDAPTFAEQKRLLSETPYGRHLEHAETARRRRARSRRSARGLLRLPRGGSLPEPVTPLLPAPVRLRERQGAREGRLLGGSAEGICWSSSGRCPLPTLPRRHAGVARTVRRSARSSGRRKVPPVRTTPPRP